MGARTAVQRRAAAAHGLVDWLRSRPRIQEAAGMFPSLSWVVLFFVVPMAILFVYSFWSMKDFRLDTHFTLANYAEMLRNRILFRAFVLSLWLAVGVTVACGVLAYPFAYFLAKITDRWRTLMLAAVIIPFWTSFILRGYAWKLLLGEHGAINTSLILLGVVKEPLSVLLYSPIGTAIGLTYAYLPFMIMPLYTSIEKVHPSWLEAAAALGASPSRAFWEITFPLCVPGLLVGCVFTFIFTLGSYVVPELLGGGKNLLVPQAIVLEFETEQNWPAGAALSIGLLMVICVTLALLFRYVRMEDVI